MLRLKPSAKIQEVYSWMKHVADNKNFVVVGNYPKRQYSDNLTESLEELGLMPNSALHLQPPEK